jgi:hypothetical protein
VELEKWEQTLHECPWRPTKGVAPCAVKVARTVLNGGDEETYRKATRLVPTQLESGKGRLIFLYSQPDMETLVKNPVLREKLEAPVNKELGVTAQAK